MRWQTRVVMQIKRKRRRKSRIARTSEAKEAFSRYGMHVRHENTRFEGAYWMRGRDFDCMIAVQKTRGKLRIGCEYSCRYVLEGQLQSGSSNH